MYGGRDDSTDSQCCINFGHFRANKIKFNTPYAVVEKNARGTAIGNSSNETILIEKKIEIESIVQTE